MVQKDVCDNCHQKQSCREIYGRLGSTGSPSALVSIVAFVLPLVVFTGSIACFQTILPTAINFIVSLSITVACIFIANAVKKYNKVKNGISRV